MKILNKLVEISKGKMSIFKKDNKKLRTSVNVSTFYNSQLNGGLSLLERSHHAPFTSIGHYSQSPSPKNTISGGNSTHRRDQLNETSVYTTTLAESGRKKTPPSAGANNDITLHFFARKREFERIDLENKKIKRHIDTSKPVLSLRQMERDFKQHVKIRGLLTKSNGLRPIESFRRKREGMSMGNKGYLPPLSTESPGKRQSPRVYNNNGDLKPIVNLTTFDYIYDDPKLMSFMKEQSLTQKRNQIQTLTEQRATDEQSASETTAKRITLTHKKDSPSLKRPSNLSTNAPAKITLEKPQSTVQEELTQKSTKIDFTKRRPSNQKPSIEYASSHQAKTSSGPKIAFAKTTSNEVGESTPDNTVTVRHHKLNLTKLAPVSDSVSSPPNQIAAQKQLDQNSSIHSQTPIVDEKGDQDYELEYDQQ
ncbi:hypothetical protein FGO68_gene6604 [Halteria grandinella]|uniref:Uncharacterized protein n=1 Tax=Halteria grandinella TaxID=5974 RepID=A0A8J8SXJ4_HALGN|nr:hypothetical protein FGO68_gene6604 [Halteria grandinella]